MIRFLSRAALFWSLGWVMGTYGAMTETASAQERTYVIWLLMLMIFWNVMILFYDLDDNIRKTRSGE